jgi:hypothetical protein
MPSKIYIDVPEDYPYEFRRYESGSQVLTRDFGVTITFICNRAAKLSQGDLYSAEFDSEGQELIFLLKSHFTVINTDVVENYIKQKRIKQNEENHRSPSRRRRGR